MRIADAVVTHAAYRDHGPWPPNAGACVITRIAPRSVDVIRDSVIVEFAIHADDPAARPDRFSVIFRDDGSVSIETDHDPVPGSTFVAGPSWKPETVAARIVGIAAETFKS